MCSGKKFFSEFFTQLFGHFRAYLRLHWANLCECQFWSKVMTSEVEERPKLVTASYGQHRSQWVNSIECDDFLLHLLLSFCFISYLNTLTFVILQYTSYFELSLLSVWIS